MQMQSSLVSVVVPVYKAEKYLRKCADSLTSQTYGAVEVVLVDDGSPDNSGAICDEYASKYENVIAIHQKSSGVSAARNSGLDAMHGEYVCFVDSDDYVEANYIEALHKALEKDDADVAVCNIMFEEGGERKTMLELPRAVLCGKNMYTYMFKANEKCKPSIYCPPVRRLFKTSIIMEHNIRFLENVWACTDQVF